MSNFNAFNIKRQAHTVSRASRDQAWNPFRHVSWKKQEGRRDTWDGSRLEAQPEGPSNSNNDGQRLSQIMSEPPRRSNANIDMNDFSTAGTTTGGSRIDTDETARSRGSENEPERIDGKAEAADSSLRNRKQDETLNSEPVEKPQGRVEDDDSNGKKKKKDHRFLRHVEPKEPFTVANQLQRTLLNSWINVLLFAAPVGIAINYVPGMNKIAVFVVNFIAIIPLAAMLSFATEEIALRTGETLGGLLNATFGNAVELIVAILALVDNQVRIVQTSLVGSILSNLLLVTGCCFFFGGLRRQEQFFNETVAQTSASMLALAVASVIVPTVFDSAANTSQPEVASLSRGTAVILLVVYAAYLFFQLKTHQEVFNAESQKVPAKPWSHSAVSSGAIKQGLLPPALMRHGLPEQSTNEDLANMIKQNATDDDDDDEGEPKLHFWVAVGTLVGSTVIIALCAEFMVDGIHAVTSSGGLSEEFVGLILLPIVGNAAEHCTAVTVAIKDKMDLSLGVAIGSSMQVALFLIPLLVIIGWGMGVDAMNLSFDTFQVAVMFVAVLLTNYLIADGKSHWLEGVLLICLYLIIAVCSYWYPATGVS